MVLQGGTLGQEFIFSLYIHQRRKGVLVTGRIGYLHPFIIIFAWKGEVRETMNPGLALSMD